MTPEDRRRRAAEQSAAELRRGLRAARGALRAMASDAGVGRTFAQQAADAASASLVRADAIINTAANPEKKS